MLFYKLYLLFWVGKQKMHVNEPQYITKHFYVHHHILYHASATVLSSITYSATFGSSYHQVKTETDYQSMLQVDVSVRIGSIILNFE